MFGRGCTVYEVPVTGGEITAKQQLNLTAGDWRVWLVGNSARDVDVIPRITTNVAHIRVAPTGGTEGSPFPTIPPTVEEQLRADMGNLADLTTEDKSSLVAAINEARQTGGGGVQPDWNQNDSTQPDYVKNRPFYTGDPVETVLVEESTVSFSFSENNGLYIAQIRSSFEATVGETYKVSWDGTAYECTCVDFYNELVIGNLSIIGEGSDTGEPFIMNVYNGQGIAIGTADTSASHTVSISATVASVVKIDEKYLRDSIISDISTAQSTASAAQSTANDAQSTANAAQSTADAAQSTADAAQSTADAAKTTADGCVKINNTDSFSINLSGKSRFFASDYGEESYYGFHKKSVTDKPIVLSIGTSGATALDISVTPSTSPTVKIIPPVYLNNMADIEIGEPSGYYRRPQITGLGGITMYSSTADSTKKFKITVDDSGTITATEVT